MPLSHATITVSRLIARHAPTEGKQPLSGHIAGRCYVCALDTDRGQRRAPSEAFTAWASCVAGDVLCPDCAATLSYRDVRMFSWLVTPDAFRVAIGEKAVETSAAKGKTRIAVDLWDTLASPPEPPFAVYVTKGGQKQGWMSGVRQVATSRERIPVLTDWTDRPILLTRPDWDRFAPLIVRLRSYGIGRTAAGAGEYTPNQWSKAVQGGYIDDLLESQQYAGDPRYEVIAHVSRKPGDGSAAVDPVPAGESGNDRAFSLHLPLG